MKRFVTIILSICLVMTLVACSQSQPQNEKSNQETVNKTVNPTDYIPTESFVVSGGPSGGNAYTVSASFADVLSRSGGIFDIIPGGGTANIVGVSTGTFDIGWGMESNLMEAIAGTEAFDKSYDNVSNIIKLDANPFIVIVPENSDIKTIYDLKGKTLATPAAGTSSQVFVRQILESCGFDINNDFTLREGGITDGSSLYQDRLVDALVTTTSYPNAGLSDLTMTISSRYIPLPDEAIEILENLNDGYSRFTYKDDAYKGMGSGYTTISSSGVMIVNNNMSIDDVYWITKTINERWDTDVVTACPWLSSVSQEERGSSRTPMHPGAEKYYREIGIVK